MCRSGLLGGVVAWRPEELSGGRSSAAEVPDKVLAGQDGGADAAEEEDQHPDGVQVGLDQPERADDQPEQDDQGHRPTFLLLICSMHLWESVEGTPTSYPERGGGTHSGRALQPRCGIQRMEGA